MEFHSVANIFPLMSTTEFKTFVDDIRANGLHEPIWTWQGQIIDGRNRYNACIELGIEPTYREWQGDESDLRSFVISANLHRRHLSESQRARIAADIETLEHGGERSQDANLHLDSVTRARAAEMFNVSSRSVADASSVRDNGIPELDILVQQDKITVSAGARIAKESKNFQQEVVKRIRQGARASDAIRETRRVQIRESLDDISAREAKETEGVFDVIVIDPPWEMKKIERDERQNQVEFEYPTMTVEQIKNVTLPLADDCHVWLWATQHYLKDAFELLGAWDLKYVCTFVWHKPGGFQPYELPQFNCEFALYARRGTPKFLDTKDFKLCFEAPRGKHSEKPELFYDTVRRVTAGRRLDMFNRRAIEGFETYGNETK